MNLATLMLPTLVKVANAINGVFEKLNNASPATKKFIAGFALLAAATAPVLLVFGALIKSVGSILSIVKFLPMAFSLLTTPIGLVVLGIAALTAGFIYAYNHSKPFHDFINGIGEKLKEGWNWISKFGEAIKDLFSGTLGGTEKATSIMEKLGLSPAAQKMVTQAVSAIKEAWQSFKDTVKEVWDYIEPTIVKGMKTVWGAIQSGLDTMKKYWNSIWPEFQPALDNLMKILDWVWHIVIEPMFLGIKIALGMLENSWQAIWATICSVLKLAFDEIKMWVQFWWDMVSGIFKVIMDLLSGNFSKAWTDMKNTCTKAFSDLWSNLKGIAGDIGSIFVNLGKSIADALLGGLAAGVNAIGGGVNWILDQVHAPKTWHLGTWTPPKFAKGTDGHEGGLAVVGDGKKKELIRTPDGHMFLSPNTDTLLNLPKGTQVVDGNTTEKMLSMGLIPKYANGTGWNPLSFIKDGWDWASSKVSSIGDMAKNFWNMATHPDQLIQSAISNFTKLDGIIGPAMGLAEGTISTGATRSLDWIKGLLSGSSDNPANASSVPTGNVSGTLLGWLTQAMGLTNTPMQYLGALAQIAMHESGGNPHAINLWDSNAKAGHPSKGLMQTIDSTFNSYAIAGLGDIWNPVANAVSAIRYMIDRYHGIGNVPGIRALSSGHNYVGYANGTSNHFGGDAILGDGGQNEPYLTPQGIFGISPKVPTLFKNLPAGTKVWSSIQKMKQEIPFYANGTISRNVVPLNGTDAIDGLYKVLGHSGSGSNHGSHSNGSSNDAIHQLLEATQDQNNILMNLVNLMGNMTMSVDGKKFAQLVTQYVTAEQAKTTNRSNIVMGVRTV
jgi:SLT domain-containing protein/phage-related protein